MDQYYISSISIHSDIYICIFNMVYITVQLLVGQVQSHYASVKLSMALVRSSFCISGNIWWETGRWHANGCTTAISLPFRRLRKQLWYG